MFCFGESKKHVVEKRRENEGEKMVMRFCLRSVLLGGVESAAYLDAVPSSPLSQVSGFCVAPPPATKRAIESVCLHKRSWFGRGPSG